MLASDVVADNLIAACNVSATDRVLEIGTGLGKLTGRLAEKAAFVKSFEIDSEYYTVVRRSLSRFQNLEVVSGDAFGYELDEVYDVCVTALPYSQSLKFVRWLALNSKFFKRSIVIVQLEFANKLLSNPGIQSFRAISVIAQISFEIQKLFPIAKTDFDPPPNVVSQALRLFPNDRLKQPFFDITRIHVLDQLFSFRGRRLSSAMRKLSVEGSSSYLSPEILSARIQNISPLEYSEILPQIELRMS
jgi:16S rRNA (adenine1518-N6/adenine1519-N6)-dimethyltransferase